MGYTDAMKKQNLTIGKLFADVRNSRGMSTRELAKALKISNSLITQYERGYIIRGITYFKSLKKKLHLTAVERDLIKKALIADFLEELDEDQ